MTAARNTAAPPSGSASWPDHYAQALADMVAKASQEAAPMRVFALLDVGAQSALQAFAAQLADPHVALFDRTPQAEFAQYSPRLVELDTVRLRDTRAIADEPLVRLANSHACVSWLLSELPLDALATHLRGWLDGMLIDDDGTDLGEVLLRFFDARVLPGFMTMLTPDQYGELMRPVAIWGTWLRSGRWQAWARPEVNLRRYSARMQRYAIAQQQHLDAATRADRLTARLRDIARKEPNGSDARALNDQLFALPHPQAYRKLSAILDRATCAGLRSDGDLLLFASLALTVSPVFDEHEAIRQSIRAAVDAGRSLALTLDSVPEDVWPALSATRRGANSPALPS